MIEDHNAAASDQHPHTAGRLPKAVIVCASTSYEPRAEMVGRFIERHFFDVLYIYSDFGHREKKKLQRSAENHIYIDTFPYKKNLSAGRLFSHDRFARNVYERLSGRSIDLLYIILPPNSLARTGARLKEENVRRLVFDIADLWPESLPFRGPKDLAPLNAWRKLRDDHLPYADLIITECELYRDILGLKKEGNVPSAVMYWPGTIEPSLSAEKEESELSVNALPEISGESGECLDIAYLGSINNILDIDLTHALLSEIGSSRKIRLHVIGDGEKREYFLGKMRLPCIETYYYGSVYDEEKKASILGRSLFGINLMKEGVCVGLSMKSTDYLAAGLLLINNIPGDTYRMVEDYGIGVNVEAPGSSRSLRDSAAEILKLAEDPAGKREKARRVYAEFLSPAAVEEHFEAEIMPLIRGEKVL